MPLIAAPARDINPRNCIYWLGEINGDIPFADMGEEYGEHGNTPHYTISTHLL